jgi:hypothetical protein
MMGGRNCHADIVFADGVVWLVGIQLSSPISPPSEVRDYVLASEAATMQFLECHTRVPSPRVFDWATESDPGNEVGVGYILMEKMKGTPLDWQGATMAQRKKVVQQLADILLEIEKHPFDKLGSLVPTTNTSVGNASPCEAQTRVQGLAQHSTFRSCDGNPPGPFSSSREAMRAIITAHLEMITTGEIGTTENAIDVFLAHRFRLDVLDSVWPGEGDERFYLKHADDKGDHILVDSDFGIVAIIDWEWCSTASQEEAFSSPCMMWPVAAFYDGSNLLADEEFLLARAFSERGREDLARCVLNGRRVQRLLFALGPGGASHQDKRTFASLFMGLKRAFDAEHGPKEEELGREEEEWEAWKASAVPRWEEDDLLQTFLRSN